MDGARCEFESVGWFGHLLVLALHMYVDVGTFKRRQKNSLAVPIHNMKQNTCTSNAKIFVRSLFFRY